MSVNLVWFKRDCRISDHLPLTKASANKQPCLLIYINEPILWQQPDMSLRQYRFLIESLTELQEKLSQKQAKLHIFNGNACDIISRLIKEHSVTAVYSHEETWNNWTYQRDIAVKKCLAALNVDWHEYPRCAIIRGPYNRDHWARNAKKMLYGDITPAPDALNAHIIQDDGLEMMQALKPVEDHCVADMRGGCQTARRTLLDFLNKRGINYSGGLSSPLSARTACSRLSAHLAFGTISSRQVLLACDTKISKLDPDTWVGKKHIRSLNAFTSRLHWRSHFMQKLEDEPGIEFNNMHSMYDGLRPSTPDEHRLLAWKNGITGLPMVDACMRCLSRTGWINFRMRAMLMSVASYHLWLDWRFTAPHLASLFIDYEPGIHYPQTQMQSGTTAINTNRVYSPKAQLEKQDPEGKFIHQWIPELKSVPAAFLSNPAAINDIVGSDYPQPIVDETHARQIAMDKCHQIRKQAGFVDEARKVYQKHGSRKRKAKRKQQHQNQDNGPQQGELPL